MHSKLHSVYGHTCCNATELGIGSEVLKLLKKAFAKAAKYIHGKGSFTPEDLAHKNVKPLITETYNVFKGALNTGITTEVPDAMLQKLLNDVFVFSGMKTYTQLKEASLLLTDNRQIKPYSKFEQDVLKIDEKYNRNYLQAEYNYAVGASQSAAQWQQYAKDGDRYNLQYRTAHDDKVRASHSALENTTLPPSDNFWNSYYPPNGWNCRCTVVQVLKSKYDASDSADAIRRGNEATTRIDKHGNNADAMFRFNPGKQQVIFPPKHPYYPQHCNGAKLNVTGLIGYGKVLLDVEADRCKAMNIIKRMKDAGQPFTIKSYENGGKIISTSLVDKKANDYSTVLNCCDHFAKQGNVTQILPKAFIKSPDYKKYFEDLIGTIYEGKCPDFKVGRLYYEHEGFVTKNKDNSLRNMLSRGVKQSSRIIIMDNGSSDNHIKRIVFMRKKEGQKIDEIWIDKNGQLRRLL